MGSSKKRKEKREKKKHKRARSKSRSHSHERDRRSHKSSQRDREKKYNRDSHRDSDYEKVSDKKRAHGYHSDEAEKVHSEDSLISKDVTKKFVSPLDQLKEYERHSSDEDFDPESLLEAKLLENSDFGSKSKFSRKRSPVRDSSEEGSNSEPKRPRYECDDSSLERFAIENLEEHDDFQRERTPELPKRSGPKKHVSEAIASLIIREKLSKTKQSDDGRIKEVHSASNSDTASPSNKKIKIKEEPKTDTQENQYVRETEDGEIGNDISSAQLSLSVNDTNKLRAKLGLKPLQTSDSIPGLGSEEAEKIQTLAKEVFVKTENMAEKVKAEKLREKLKTMKDKRKITEKLRKVKGLAESDSEEESAAAWVAKSRQLQIEKEKAEKRAKLLEEMDAEFGIGALVEEEFVKKDKIYTSDSLKGLTVAHSTDSIKEGQKVILTLKDKDVLNEDDDVLENVNIIDEERYARNVENRKKKPVYKPYDEPEYDEFGILKTKSMLSKYDEEEKQPKSFKLGVENFADKERELELIRMKLKQQAGVSLEMTNMKIASEYYTPDEMVQFKKPKRKSRKLRKRETFKADDLLSEINDNSKDFGSRNGSGAPEEDMQTCVDNKNLNQIQELSPIERDEDTVGPSENFSNVVIEEDQAEKELHAALNKARKLKQRKAVVSGPERIAEMMRNAESKEVVMTVESKTSTIVLNSTAEFCRTLGEIPTYGMSGNRDEEADELMDFERELMEENRRKETEAQNRGAWNEVHIDEEPAEILIKENEPILEEEPDIRFGVAGALALAQKKGYLDKDNKKQSATPRSSSLQAQSYTIEEKFYDDDKFGKRERYTGPVQDFREKSNYKPDVKLEYIDDSGRLLSPKEAFRYLSHKFHGKGPGKNKVDKRMKKVDQETRLKQMSSTDTPLNTVKLLQVKQKEMQSPYIVLSGGSKTLTQTMISKKV